jgi:hypothetical protein
MAAFGVTGTMSTARYAHTAALLNNGMVLIVGGYGSSGPLASAELYNSAAGAFAVTGSMSAARFNHTETLLNSGIVLMVGGQSSSGILASAELY